MGKPLQSVREVRHLGEGKRLWRWLSAPVLTVALWDLVAVLPCRHAAAQRLALLSVGIGLLGVHAERVAQVDRVGPLDRLDKA